MKFPKKIFFILFLYEFMISMCIVFGSSLMIGSFYHLYIGKTTFYVNIFKMDLGGMIGCLIGIYINMKRVPVYYLEQYICKELLLNR